MVLAVLPDRTTGRDWGLKYLRMAVDDLNRIRPDAVISIGDMIQGYTRSIEQWDREVAEYRGIVDRLMMPFYPLAGNHEVVSGTRDRQDLTFQERYQQTFAPLYYAVEFDLASVVVLYSDDPAYGEGFGLGTAQLAWLEQCLERLAARERPILVLLHRPLWRSRASGWSERVHPLLVRYGVHAVIGGHSHSLQRDPDWDGIQYHIVGTCGGMIDQLPLAGQLQHLTFIRVEPDGAVAIYHQAVGTTMPDDFVLRADQDRVNRLKSDDQVVRFVTPVSDPFLGPVRETIDLEVFNPVDVPIEVSGRLVKHSPTPESWTESTWNSRMEEDRFNPHTTDVGTPFRTPHGVPSRRLEPNERAIIRFEVESPAIDAPRNPPEFEFRATFEDGHGRNVPTILRRRLPVRRLIDTAREPIPWPLCAWQFSVYETPEPNPTVTLSRAGQGILLHLTVPDDRLSIGTGTERRVHERHVDPPSDAIALMIGDGPNQRRFYLEPRGGLEVFEVLPDGSRRSTIQANLVDWRHSTPGWGVAILIPPDLLQAEPRGGDIRINVGVADNDDTYHTQWRWLAPAGYPASVR